MNVMYRLILKLEHKRSQRCDTSLVVDLHQMLFQRLQTFVDVNHLCKVLHIFCGVPDLCLIFFETDMSSHDRVGESTHLCPPVQIIVCPNISYNNVVDGGVASNV